MNKQRITFAAVIAAAALVFTGCASQPATDPTTAPETTAPVATTEPTTTPVETATAAPPPVETATSAPEVTETPAPVETNAPTGTLPASCDELGSAETRAATVDKLGDEQGGATVDESAPEGATLALGCSWFAGDVTGTSIYISTVEEGAAQFAFEQWHDSGGICDGDNGWSQCRFDSEGDYNGNKFPKSEMVMYRGDTWVTINSSNLDTAQLALEIGQTIWG